MRKSKAYEAFRDSDLAYPVPRLIPYQRCTCGDCPECHDNAKWDRVFAKFEVKEPEVHGMFQCPLNDL
jgi:hypothetical protein